MSSEGDDRYEQESAAGLGDELPVLLEFVRRFVRRDIWLWEKRIDPNASRLPADVFGELHGRVSEFGLDHLMAPRGSCAGPALDLPDWERARIVEEIAQHRAGLLYPAYGLFDPDLPPQLYAATTEQRRAFLLPLIERKAHCFRGLDDPDLAGLPVDGVRARALRQGDRWMLDGTKIFVADAEDADFGLVYANSEWSAGEREGVSLLVVETDRTGFQRWRPWPTVAVGRDTMELNLSAVKLPELNLLGEPGAGPAFANGLVLRRRVFTAAQVTGVASAAQDIARGGIWSRSEDGLALARGERARLALADNEIAVSAARQLYLAGATATDSDGALLEPVLAAQVFALDAASAVVGRTMHLLGVAAASADLPLERWARELQWLRVTSGGADRQRLAIAAKLVSTFKK